MAIDVAQWLLGLGLEQYTSAFADNDIDSSILPELTADDLTALGITSVGHRRRLLSAIAALGTVPQPQTVSASPSTATDAERRQLTVMFCDLVDSTPLSLRLDPEELRQVFSSYHRCIAEVVRRYSGFIAKYMGDGVLIYFGFPIAHEDDAERAVRAGLEITTAVSRLEAAGMQLGSRVGIATGLVVVGDLDSGDVNAVLGDTPNLAARLQAEAPPNGVVIAPATRRLTGAWFRYRELGPRSLKGIPEPVTLTQVLGKKAAESRFAAVRSRLLTPFVGREQELALLTERWETTTRAEGQVVLLSGEPGIGKSRLSEMLRERVKGAGSWIRYQCSPYYTDTALHPIIAQLTAAAGIEPDDLPDIKLDKLERVILPSAIERGIAFPLLADLLSIPVGDRYPPLRIGPELRKVRTLQLLSEQLVLLAAHAPVLAQVEDAHWIDPTTRELVESLI